MTTARQSGVTSTIMDWCAFQAIPTISSSAPSCRRWISLPTRGAATLRAAKTSAVGRRGERLRNVLPWTDRGPRPSRGAALATQFEEGCHRVGVEIEA